jgi:hypothetical protein
MPAGRRPLVHVTPFAYTLGGLRPSVRSSQSSAGGLITISNAKRPLVASASTSPRRDAALLILCRAADDSVP